jgi:hypothetical protein
MCLFHYSPSLCVCFCLVGLTWILAAILRFCIQAGICKEEMCWGIQEGWRSNQGWHNLCMHMQAMQSIGDSSEETVLLHHVTQTANNSAVHCLNQAVYDARHLQAMLLVMEQEERVMEPNTVECQLVLVKTKGHGGHIIVTQGSHDLQ